MKKLNFIFLLIVSIFFTADSFAKSNIYIYRHRADWVKLSKLSKKQLGDTQLLHPFEISIPQMETMLLSLSLNKASAFKKEVKEKDIFNLEEARKYAPFLVEALHKASPNEVVNMSVIQKRAYFVMRSDYLTMVNVFATEEGVHFNFRKLFAKLDGDYEQASKLDRAIRDAKSLRVSLEAKEGQKIAFQDPMELILDPRYDFSGTGVALRYEEEPMPRAKEDAKKKKSPYHEESVAVQNSQNTKDRLTQLEELKSSRLISDKEYERKRQEILNSL